MANKTPSISLCMIVKNEEGTIMRALNSIKDKVSEMIVVDTGSTDNTVAIAKKLGAKIFFFEWKDDFSAARNFALDHAGGDWILHLDADEELVCGKRDIYRLLEDQESTGAQKKTSARNKIHGYRVRIIDEDSSIENSSLVRIFRNDPNIRYTDRIHEHPEFKNKAYPLSKLSPLSYIRIIHHGYSPEKIASYDKFQRNYSILKKGLGDDPNNLNYLYHLGQELVTAGQMEEALIYLRQAFHHKDVSDLPIIYRTYLLTLMHSGGGLEETHEVLEAALRDHSNWLELYFLRAVYLFMLGQLDKAEQAFKSLDNIPINNDLPVTVGAGRGLPGYFLGLIGKFRAAGSPGPKDPPGSDNSRFDDGSIKLVANDVGMIFFVLSILIVIFPREVVDEEIRNILRYSSDAIRKHVLEVIEL